MYLPGSPTPIPGGVAEQSYPATQPPRNSLDAPSPEEMAANYDYLSNWGAAITRAESATGFVGSAPLPTLGPVGSNLEAEIAAAPKIGRKDEYQTPICTDRETNASICPPASSAPGWGNSGVSFPGPKPCSTGIVGWVSANPWLFIGLVVVGGFALDSLMQERN